MMQPDCVYDLEYSECSNSLLWNNNSICSPLFLPVKICVKHTIIWPPARQRVASVCGLIMTFGKTSGARRRDERRGSHRLSDLNQIASNTNRIESIFIAFGHKLDQLPSEQDDTWASCKFRAQIGPKVGHSRPSRLSIPKPRTTGKVDSLACIVRPSCIVGIDELQRKIWIIK